MIRRTRRTPPWTTRPPPASTCIVEREAAIVTVTFNRPEARNAMTWAMYQRLYEVCEEVDADDAVRVLVLKAPAARRSSPEPTSPVH
jgi:1,4-dihydroxy-2-naphthoyl-CoA synthase